MTSPPVTPRQGSVAGELVAAVDAAVSSEGITRAEAFRRIAERTGRNAASVSTTYYVAVRGRPSPGASRRKPSRRDHVSDALQRVQAAFNDLRAAAAAQEEELQDLRRNQADIAAIKRAITHL